MRLIIKYLIVLTFLMVSTANAVEDKAKIMAVMSIITSYYLTTEDTTAPIINLNNNSTVFLNLNDTYTETVTAIDAVDGKVEVIIEGNVDISVAGRYLLKYKAIDGSGNTSTARRIVYVRDSSGSIVYENGEDTTTQAWFVADPDPTGAKIENVYDEERGSRVIKFIGDIPSRGINNGYRLGDTRSILSTSWNNTDHKEIRWSMQYRYTFRVYINVTTANHGNKTLWYSNVDEDLLKSKSDPNYIHHGLGLGSAIGTWMTFTRDLEQDLKEVNNDFELTKVNNFYLKGNGSIDDIKMGNNLMPPIVTLKGDSVTCINKDSTYTESGADAIDKQDGNVNVYIEGEVDTTRKGTYILNYTALDSLANKSSVTRRVYVVDDTSNAGENCWKVKTYLEKVYIPDIGNDKNSDNDIFRIFYSLEDPKHKIDFIDKNNNNIADKIENIAFQFENIQRIFEKEMGLTNPLHAFYNTHYNNKVKYIDVLVNNINHNGFGTASRYIKKYIYSAVKNNDYALVINLDTQTYEFSGGTLPV